MRFLTSVPKVAGKGLHVWLGIVLLMLLIFQIGSGIQLVNGNTLLVPYHRFAALFLLMPVAAVHAYYGLGVWFFGFKYSS